MKNVLERIRSNLRENSDEKIKESGKRFFKENVKLYGVKTALVSRISKECFKEIKDRSKSEIFEICEELWKSGYMEESFIACHFSYSIRKDFEEKDFKIFENWIEKYISNWASCDTFCNHTIGEFLEKFPSFLLKLKEWAKADNRWMRRASAVSLIVPARKGLFLKEILEISDILLCDKDDMVQKGYGWMLKVASQLHQKEIFDYVMKNKKVMPRTALRYAIEKMPESLRREAMKK